MGSQMLSILEVPSVKCASRAMNLPGLLFSYANTAFTGVTGCDDAGVITG